MRVQECWVILYFIRRRGRGLQSEVFMIYAAAAIVLAAIVYFCWRQNNKIDNMEITIVSDRLKRDVTVVHLSDMHSKLFGKG